MEVLSLVSSVTTIVKLANDIDGAVKAASRSKKSCEKLAERVEGIGELLKALGDGSSSSSSSSPSTAMATRKLVSRLERALRRALLLVTSCQSTSRIYGLVAGGWQSDQFDKVNAEIDRCLLDLSLSSLALVSSIDHKLNAATATAGERNTVEVVAPPLPPVKCSHGHDQDDGEDKMAGGAAEKNGELICYVGEQDGKTETDAGEVTTTTAIGVPAAAAAYMHYQLSPPPPPPPCYGYHLHYCHCTHGHCHCAGGRHYSPWYYSDDSADVRLRHMFSDENPNACSIM